MPRTTVSAVLALLIAFAASLLAGCNGDYEETPPKVYQPGEVFWSYRHASQAVSSPPFVVDGVADGVAYVRADYDGVYALDAATGEVLWYFKLDGGMNLPLELVEGVVLVRSSQYQRANGFYAIAIGGRRRGLRQGGL